MAFTGTEGNPIDQTKAAAWTKSYRAANPNQIQSRFFGRDILLNILDQGGCKGIRLYYALNDETPQLIAVGADSEENDQLGDGCIIADDAPSGPPRSGQPNALNS